MVHVIVLAFLLSHAMLKTTVCALSASLLLLVIVVAAWGQSQALTAAEIEQRCRTYGDMSKLFATQRDNGWTLNDLAYHFRQSKSANVAELFWNQAVEVYASPWMTPEMARERAEQQCYKALQPPPVPETPPPASKPTTPTKNRR